MSWEIELTLTTQRPGSGDMQTRWIGRLMQQTHNIRPGSITNGGRTTRGANTAYTKSPARLSKGDTKNPVGNGQSRTHNGTTAGDAGKIESAGRGRGGGRVVEDCGRSHSP